MSSKPESQPEHSGWKYHGDEIPDRAMLEKVLQETIAAEEVEPLHEPEMNALLSVAKRYLGARLTLEPVAVELVESILRVRMPHLNVPPEYWQSMSREIARTLLEAPSTEKRFHSFWGRLSEAAA